MGQEPRRFVSDAQVPMKLMGANALLGGRHQEERLKPDVQLDMAAFHDALGGDAEILAALLDAAAVDARLLGGEGLVDGPAVRANAIGAPAKGFKVFPGSFGGLEMGRVEHGFGHGEQSGCFDGPTLPMVFVVSSI